MAPYFAFLHHLAAFALVAALAVELVLLKGELTLQNARKIRQADMLYGAAAGLVVVVGILRAAYFEKGSAYYLNSMSFWAKMAAFALVGLASLLPTFEFLAWGGALKAGRVPELSAARLRRLRAIVHAELVGIGFILLFAALMAKGVGLRG